MFTNDRYRNLTPPKLLDIHEADVGAAINSLLLAGERVTIPLATFCRALEIEQVAAQQPVPDRDGAGESFLRLGETIDARVLRLYSDYLGYVGEDREAAPAAARLLAFDMFHDPSGRNDTTVPMWDMTEWPFNHINWEAAAAELDEIGSFEFDVFIVDGHAFRRQWTDEELRASSDTLFR